MIEYSIRAEGLKELIALLKKSPRIAQRHQRRAMRKSVLVLERVFKVYPAAPAGSRYSRTGTLGRRWLGRVEAVGQLTRGILDNPTSYADLVMGEGQADVHKGRWETVTQRAKKAEGEIRGIHEEAVADAVREIEGG